MINRRSFFRGLLAVPVAAVTAPLANALTPKQSFASGGIVPDLHYLVGEHRLPLSIEVSSHARVPGELIIDIKCDTAILEKNLDRFRKAWEDEMNRCHPVGFLKY
jgi:hypothetical protein